jgi:hypothetical protein
VNPFYIAVCETGKKKEEGRNYFRCQMKQEFGLFFGFVWGGGYGDGLRAQF